MDAALGSTALAQFKARAKLKSATTLKGVWKQRLQKLHAFLPPQQDHSVAVRQIMAVRVLVYFSNRASHVLS
jgi:hypothetical protein